MGETAKYTDKMSVRHILIVISGIMITFGCSALVFSTWSAFQAVVPEQLGVDTATWALYITVLYLAEAFSAPFIGKLLAKTDIRIVLSVSALLVGLGFILISIVKTLWIFYVAGLMMGLGEVGLLWLAVPSLCNKWFNKNSGTIIGACMAFTGIGGAIWLQVFNALNASGVDIWTIYMIWGIAALVTSLPFTLLCIRSTPEECGCLPSGAPQTASGKPAGLDAGKAMKSVAFYAVFLLARTGAAPPAGLEQARQDNAEAMFSGHDIPAEKAAAMQRFVQEVLQACRKKRNPLQRFADRWFHIWY